MRALVDKHDFLNRGYSREKFRGYVANRSKIDILKERSKLRRDYTYYRELLGDRAPSSLNKYKEIWYNGGEEYRELKDAARWIKSPFPTAKSLKGHFKSHDHEFGDITVEEYQRMAAELLSKPVSDSVLGYDTKNRRVRYDVEDNIFSLGNPKTG